MEEQWHEMIEHMRVLTQTMAQAPQLNHAVHESQQGPQGPTRSTGRPRGPPPPTFSGATGERADDFLFCLETFVRYHRIDDDDQRLLLAISCLQGHALTWYRSLDPAPTNMHELQEQLRASFKTIDEQRQLRDQLRRLRQDGNVQDYVFKFRQLMVQIDDMSRLDRIEAFIHGLRPRTRQEVSFHGPDTLEQAYQLASRYDRNYTTANSSYRRGAPPTQPPKFDDRAMDIDAIRAQRPLRRLTDQERDELRRRGACFRCRREGHLAADCPLNASDHTADQDETHKTQGPQDTTDQDETPKTQGPQDTKTQETQETADQDETPKTQGPQDTTDQDETPKTQGHQDTKTQEAQDTDLSDQPPSTDNATINLVSARRIAKDLRGSGVDAAFVLVLSMDTTPSPSEDPRTNALLEEFADVFPEELPGLPPRRDIDHAIDLKPGATPPSKAPYRLSTDELKELRTQLDELLAKGLIEASTSPYGAPILFVKKKDGTRRMCIDYRQLNAQTVKDSYPLPLIDDIIDSLCDARDLLNSRPALRLSSVRIRAGDEDKTTFRTRYGTFRFLVLPFGLTNAPPTFQRLVNNVFKQEMDKFMAPYIDDLVIYSKNEKEHEQHLRQRQPFEVATDASDRAIGAVLLQDGQPVAYESRKLQPAELNYPVRDKEALALIYALTKWRVYLLDKRTTILTDHRSLTNITTQKTLNGRWARWIELLNDYDLDIRYIKGKTNVAADAVSRIPDSDAQEITCAAISTATPADLVKRISNDIAEDEEFGPIYKALKNPDQTPPPAVAAKLSRFGLNDEDLLIYQEHPEHPEDIPLRWCIPETARVPLLAEFHDTPTAGHQGIHRTHEALARHFYWPRMRQDVERYVRSCKSCQRHKPRQGAAPGPLQPLPVPREPWTDISLDLVTGLPRTRTGQDAIVVFVDRLTKRCHLAATTSKCTGRDVAKLFIFHVFRHHGLPARVVSDRDPRFTGAFWKETFRLLGSRLQFSTSQHPQTDGQTERTNRTMEQTLRHYVNYRMDNWDSLLPVVEFALNNSKSDSTGQSPFFLETGRHPIIPATLVTRQAIRRTDTPAAEDFVVRLKSIITAARDALAQAQDKQKRYADQRRSDDIKYSPGDQAWVTADLFVDQANQRRPKDKLKPRWQGPFTVIDMPSRTTVRLRFPSHVRAHPVVNVTKTKPCVNSPSDFNTRPNDEPPPLPDGESDEYEVERILDERVRRGKRQYLIKWAGYDINDSTWINEDQLTRDVRSLIMEWHQASRNASA
ncbi:hypothetical protein PTSG_11674 [Salpingoeca rosetta]|uniref:Reverse transcriptase n=1 Tax=Salpingoeca rosetta (strain ATCC 50818 / BSB-021) TaxID=946362 RepID=F2TY75_SALR5|nr:uncharacterized protein PTSG_11674 [Salpingoeca rosetta]EGD76334.1 hypothetical protein PTSG_11674 [Salpingoeca rosetta]|eukprot:XP_004998509.1 hypothetical protein PTSG_11674 [Salpingoeca rosetta]